MVKKFTEVSPYTGRDIGEEGPTNTTGPSVAGTGDDSSVVVVRKKKKETLYDGRTKHARRFVERILKMREKRKVSESKMSDLHAMIADGSSAQEISKELKIPLKTVKELMKGFKEEIELGEGDIRKVNVKKSGTDFDVIYKGNTKYGRNKLIGYFSRSGSGFEVYHDNEDMKDDFQQSDFVKTERQAIDLIFDTAESNGVIKEEVKLNEQPEHEITVGDYTTSHFYMCGSAQKVMSANSDKEGAEELTKMQDEFYKLEKDVMEAGEATDEQKDTARDLYNKIMSKAGEVGLADDIDDYMKQHLDSVVKGDPKPGFGRTDESFEIDEGLMATGLFSSNPREINKAGFDLTKFMKRRPPANINGMKKFSDFVQKYISEDRMGDRLDMMAGRMDNSYDFDHEMFLKLDPRGVVLDTLLQYDRNLGALLMARTLIDYGVQVVQINMDKAKQGMYSVNVGRASRKSVQSGIDGIYGTMAYKGINYAPKTEVKEMNFTKNVLKQSNEFAREYELVENNLKVLQNIVKNKQNMKMKFKDKQAKVDLFTASAIMNVYNAVRPDNKKKLEKLMNGKIADFMKLQSFAMKQIK